MTEEVPEGKARGHSKEQEELFGGASQVTTVSGQCHCSPLFDKFQGENKGSSLLYGLWLLYCCSYIDLDWILATAKTPGMSKGEQCGKNQFKL